MKNSNEFNAKGQ